MSLLDQLAGFARGPLRGAEGARALMRLSLFDWVVNALAGRRETVARIVAVKARDEGGAGQVGLAGGGRVPAPQAALANATAAQALDYADTHVALLGSPSVAVLGAALAMAERQGAGLAAVVDAALVGAEGALRLGLWLGRSHHQAGFDPVTTAGAFGAALAAGRVLGLEEDEHRAALSLAAARAAGLRVHYGSMAAPLAVGQAAQTGVDVALFARMGMRARAGASTMEGPLGFGAAHAGDRGAVAFDGLGQHWLFEGVEHRFHACSHGLHAMIEAVAGIRPDAAKIAAVTVQVNPRWIGVCDIAAPTTGMAARHSLAQAAAMAIAGIDTASPASFSDANTRDAALVSLRDRVTVAGDPDLTEMQARVKLTLKTGQVVTALHDLDEAPRAFVQRRDRLMAKARALIGDEARAIQDAIVRDDLPGLVAILGKSRPD